MKSDRLLNDGEALRRIYLLPDLLGVVLRFVPVHLEPNVAVIDLHLVPDLAAQQLVDRNTERLAGDVPERHLDSAHCGAPWFKCAHTPDAQHHPLYVCRILPDDHVPVEHHHRLQVRLGGLPLAQTIDAFIGRYPNNCRSPDDCAFQVCDLHISPSGTLLFRCCPRDLIPVNDMRCPRPSMRWPEWGLDMFT